MNIENLQAISVTTIKPKELHELFSDLYLYTGYPKNLLEKLNQSYFVDPASTKYHCAFKYGLLLHSVNVAILTYQNLQKIKNLNISKFINSLSDDEFKKYCKDSIFAALFHDYCKVGCYISEPEMTEPQRNKIINECNTRGLDFNNYINKLGKKSASTFIDRILKNDIESLSSIQKQYEFNDPVSIGHGEKSVIQLLQLGFQLTEHQIIAIRYHMLFLDFMLNTDMLKYTLFNAVHTIPMLRAIYLAEQESCYLYEELQ